MQIICNSVKNVSVIAKTETPYNMNGVSGVTYRVALLLDGDVEKIKVASKEVYDSINPMTDYCIEFVITVSNGSVREPKISAVWPVKK